MWDRIKPGSEVEIRSWTIRFYGETSGFMADPKKIWDYRFCRAAGSSTRVRRAKRARRETVILVVFDFVDPSAWERRLPNFETQFWGKSRKEGEGHIHGLRLWESLKFVRGGW